MANVSFNVGYSGYVIVVQRVPTFFNQDWAKQFGYQITLSLSFQLIGYGLAGLSRRFLVYPAAAIWPRNLVSRIQLVENDLGTDLTSFYRLQLH